jgi:hypothetical protein
MVYRGICSTVATEPNASTLSLQRRALPSILHGLGCKSEVQVKAVTHALSRLSAASLLPARPLAGLPLTVIAGPWSKLVPDSSVDGWGEPQMRVTNAWLAGGGHIQADISDEEAAYDYSWGTEPGTDMVEADLKTFHAGVPSTYVAVWPSELLEAVFPNITDCGIVNPNARKALLDVVLVADMLRGDCPCLKKEYPLFVVLPDVPTLLDSVNQGKTTFCTHYAKAAVPGLAQEMKFRDSTSAPDQRAIAHELRMNGTACLDEFSIPRSTSAFLSRENLASLSTGGAVSAGMVLSNGNEKIMLSHALFMSCKALDMTEDLLTRGIYIFLRALSNEERSMPGVWESLKTARLSILLRLGALAMIQANDLAAKLNARQHSTAGWRYGAHRSLAMILYQIRTGCSDMEAEKAVLDAVLENRNRMIEHMRKADDEGVVMSQQQSRDMRMTLEQMFSETGSPEIKLMADYLNAKATAGAPTAKSASCGMLAKARMAVEGRQDQPLSIGFNQWTNLGSAIGDRMVSTLIGNEVKKRIPEGHGWRIPGMAGVDGWFLFRRKSRADGQTLVSLVQVPAVQGQIIAAP